MVASEYSTYLCKTADASLLVFTQLVDMLRAVERRASW